MDSVISWAGSPEVTLVSEEGTEVKVHRILLALYTDQWRQTLQGLEISQLVLLLQDVGAQELDQLVTDIYKPFTATGDNQVIRENYQIERQNYPEDIDEYDDVDFIN